MDKKLLDALNNLSFALETISGILSQKSDKKSDTEKALSSGDISKKFGELSKSISNAIENGFKKVKTPSKDNFMSEISKKIASVEVSLKKVLSSTQQIPNLQKSIAQTRTEIESPKENLKLPKPRTIEIPLRYGKLQPLILPIPKPIQFTFAKFKLPEVPKLPKVSIDFVVSRIPKLPKLPTIPNIVSKIDYTVSKLPKLPTISNIKSSIDYIVSKLPTLPIIPNIKSIIDYVVSKLPKLPTISGIKSSIDFLVSKLPKLPTISGIKSSIDYIVSKLPKLPTISNIESSINYVVSKLPKLPTISNIKSSISYVVSKLPKLQKYLI